MGAVPSTSGLLETVLSLLGVVQKLDQMSISAHCLCYTSAPNKSRLLSSITKTTTEAYLTFHIKLLLAVIQRHLESDHSVLQ